LNASVASIVISKATKRHLKSTKSMWKSFEDRSDFTSVSQFPTLLVWDFCC